MLKMIGITSFVKEKMHEMRKDFKCIKQKSTLSLVRGIDSKIQTEYDVRKFIIKIS